MSTHTTPATNGHVTPRARLSRGPDSLNGQAPLDNQAVGAVGGTTSPATEVATTPRDAPSRGTEAADRHPSVGTQQQDAAGADIPARQDRSDIHSAVAGGDTDSAATTDAATPKDDASLPPDVAGPQATAVPAPTQFALADPLLALAADVLDDLEKVRIANENRLRQLTRSTEDSDGEERGFGLDESHPDVARLAALVDMLGKAEHQAELNLKRQLRQHPLGPWVKAARGVGEKQAARLLAAVGDPYWNHLHDRPRTVSELWSYCGYRVVPVGRTGIDAHAGSADGDRLGSNLDQGGFNAQHESVGVAAVRARGQKANWSAAAKMRAYLVAVSIVKAGGPYREVYDKARAKYDDAVHQVECKRCGPSGRPAQPGSPLSAGHQHARALRIVAKEVLKDLWRAAKEIHEAAPATTLSMTPKVGSSSGFNDQDSGHGAADAQANSAAVHKHGDGQDPSDTQRRSVVADHTEESRRSPASTANATGDLNDTTESTP